MRSRHIRSISSLLLGGNGVLASSNYCPGNVKISSQSDADALNNCQTINGPLTVADASGTISIPKVQDIRGPLTIQNSPDLNALAASNLQTVSGAIAITDNAALNTLSLSNLQTVGGELKVQGNDGLKELRLDNLEKVNGNMDLSGNFDRISLGDLENVYGDTKIQSSGSFQCSDLDKLVSDEKVFKSSFSCNDKKGSSSGLSSGAKAGIAVGVIVGVILAVLLAWLCVRRKRKQQQKDAVLAGLTAAGAAGAIGKDVEKADNKVSTTASNGSPSSPQPPSDTGVMAASNIPRRPVSTTPQAPVPAALVPGDRSSRLVSNPDDPSLFLHPIPRRTPSESEVPMLDSENVHEAPPPEVGRQHEGLFELDAGPVSSTHQQAINHG